MYVNNVSCFINENFHVKGEGCFCHRFRLRILNFLPLRIEFEFEFPATTNYIWISASLHIDDVNFLHCITTDYI